MADERKITKSAETGRIVTAAGADPSTTYVQTVRSAETVRSREEIEQQIDDANDSSSIGADLSRYPDLNYEDGVVAALAWVLGRDETKPMDD